MKRGGYSSWRANFFAGLAVVFPVVISIAIFVWLFGTIANITDSLLILFPREWTHKNNGDGPMHWYWSLIALVLAVLLISLIGSLARYYLGKKLIELVDLVLLRVPLLNKIYGTIKQVNEAFGSGSKTSFKTVVLVEFPREGMYEVSLQSPRFGNWISAKRRFQVYAQSAVAPTPAPTATPAAG